jgi:hypothetical protein
MEGRLLTLSAAGGILLDSVFRFVQVFSDRSHQESCYSSSNVGQQAHEAPDVPKKPKS